MFEIIIFFLMLGVLVLAHEAGHFFVARWNGVGAEEFGFGFPPRLFGFYKDRNGKWRVVFGNKEVEEAVKKRSETIYSVNLLPLGGFVKITGENGEDKENPESFAGKGALVRIGILVAGVVMNYLLAIFLFTGAFWLGMPESIDDSEINSQAKVQIASVAEESPAKVAGLQMADEMVAIITAEGKRVQIEKIEQMQNLIKENKGRELIFEVKRAGEQTPKQFKLAVRNEAPKGQGLTGVELVRTAFVRHGLPSAFWSGVRNASAMVWEIVKFLGDLLAKLFRAQPLTQELAGPVGIAVMTGKVAKMGLGLFLQFAGMLSINLAVLNLLPIPALDGGRILFILIEKIKGSPVSQKVEGFFHLAGFALLMLLMISVTVKDFRTFGIWEKIVGLF